MLDYTDISNAFVQKLLAIPSLPDVALENASYTPTTGTPYLRTKLMPEASTTFSIARSDLKYNGMFQIEAVYPIETGTSQAMNICAIIAQEFMSGAYLEYGDACITIEEPEQLQGYRFEDRYIVPLRINYYANKKGV
jgi:hypothetical protein